MTTREFLVRRAAQFSLRIKFFLVASGLLVCIGLRIFALRFACAVVMGVLVLAAL